MEGNSYDILSYKLQLVLIKKLKELYLIIIIKLELFFKKHTLNLLLIYLRADNSILTQLAPTWLHGPLLVGLHIRKSFKQNNNYYRYVLLKRLIYLENAIDVSKDLAAMTIVAKLSKLRIKLIKINAA